MGNTMFSTMFFFGVPVASEKPKQFGTLRDLKTCFRHPLFGGPGSRQPVAAALRFHGLDAGWRSPGRKALAQLASSQGFFFVGGGWKLGANSPSVKYGILKQQMMMLCNGEI
jgi:hypothetical protein